MREVMTVCTQNWRAMPLVSLYVAIALTANTTTKKALRSAANSIPTFTQRHKGLRCRNREPQHNS